MKVIRVVGAAIIRDGRVLAAQRGAAMSLAGLWEFPGGKIEQGESAQNALVRELREELACTVEVGDPVGTSFHDYPFGTVQLTTFYGRIIEGEPIAGEHSELRWCDASELLALEWAPADVTAAAEVGAHLTTMQRTSIRRNGSDHRL